MNPRFADPRAQASFDAKGYAVLDFLEHTEIDCLRDLCRRHVPESFDGIFTNVHLLSPEVNQAIEQEMLRVLSPRLEAALPEYLLAGGTFIVKSARPDRTSFSLHQDPNVVDERTFNSLALWVPLVDTNVANGGLCVLPGSHATRYTVRCPQFPSLLINFDETIEPYVDHVLVKAGQCCIFSHRLFHGSPPNTSGASRPIIHGGLIPRGVQSIYHFIDDAGRMSVLKITDSTFVYTALRSLVQGVLPPDLPVVEVLDGYPPQLTRDEVLAMTARQAAVANPVRPPENRGPLARLRDLFTPSKPR